jgi:spermidine synthase
MSDPDAQHDQAPPRYPMPYVREELDSKSLHFSMSEIQSRMQIRRPDMLELEYTRAMMGFLLFKPEPERIAMIGLGGGSLAKFCHRHLPRASLLVVEINPHVIALRDAFQVPRDDARLKVVQDDGARFVEQTQSRFDVLMVDAFDANGMPAALGAQRFYDDCCDALAPRGVLAVNLHAGHAHFPVYVDRIARAFDDHTVVVDDSDGTNSVVFASKHESVMQLGSGPLRPTSLAAEPWEQLRDAFARVASAARAVSR